MTKHETLEGCRFLIAQRLEPDGSLGAEPLVIVDRIGAAQGSTVLVSTDGDMRSGTVREHKSARWSSQA